MQNHFSHALDYETGDWCGNYAGSFCVGLTKGRLDVDLPSILRVNIVLSWVLLDMKQRGRWEFISSLTGSRSFGGGHIKRIFK
ncbi:hypothetical protein TNCV_3310641 [Trichonephila clavipes]|nr:hypothetical protein TNCV_3310641 [Trichonephila clavipes]